MGITLWIVPSEDEMLKLKRIMSIRPKPSSSTLEPQSYPTFDPHITLASLPISPEIPLSKLRESIPRNQSLKINFKRVDSGDHFFRSVYIAISLTPELEELHQKVHETLNLEPRTPKFPHISLCYITDTDAEHGERQRYLEELKSTGRIREASNSDGLELDCGLDGKDEWLAGFITSEIWITECEGPVESWKILEKISLS